VAVRAAQSAGGPEARDVSIDPGSIDRVIHEPARLAIVATLAVVDEADFVYLMRHTGLTEGNIASHCARLQTAGYLDVDKSQAQGRRRTVYRLTSAGIAAFARYRATMRAVLG